MNRTVVTTPGTCSGQPRLSGTRITVRRVVERFMAGTPIAEVAVRYGLVESDVSVAIRYAMKQRRRGRGTHG